MTSNHGLQLTFWGVRGSIATPEVKNLGHGGNTSCLEVRYRDQPPLIFDAGSGLRRLCQALSEAEPTRHDVLRVFLTHFHWDHIQGVPFLQQLYDPEGELIFYAGCSAKSLRRALTGQMTDPYFPVELANAPAHQEYRQLDPKGETFGDLTVRPFPLRHPGGAHGYRVDTATSSIVYASDHEHGDPQYDDVLREYAQHADVLVYDAQFTPQEYQTRKGWGHSTWLEATRVAQDAQVNQLILFHHDPNHDDDLMTQIVGLARGEFENTVASREGLLVSA